MRHTQPTLERSIVGVLLSLRRSTAMDGSDDDFSEVMRIVEEDVELVPELLRAMVATAPAGKLARIGTGPIEDLQMGIEFGYRTEPLTIDLIIAADLTPDVLFAVLKGAYASYLAEMDIDVRLRGKLSDEQIAWLLREDIPGRYE